MEYKFSVEYSFNSGEIDDSIGCNSFNQAKEIGNMLFDSNKSRVDIEFIRIWDDIKNIVILVLQSEHYCEGEMKND